jgi:enterochelin esterase-like enzyme
VPEPLRGLFITQALDGRPRADAYLRVMGSNMGGLITMYALTEYPQVFGGAACLSTHWIGGLERNTEIPDAALRYLAQALPALGAHRLCLDRGTLELDALYDTAQARVDALMRERGFAAPHFSSRVFEGTGHTEVFWRERLHILRFLLEA